jgi:hypothetical protein
VSDDPLEQLKREIEAEQFGGRYAPPTPRVRFELDRASVPRGENLSGIIVIEAGRRDLWLDQVNLFIAGMARTVGSRHAASLLSVSRHVNVPAGDSRSLPLWVQVPSDAPLGGKMLWLKGAPVSAVAHFTVDPERHYADLIEALESVARVDLQAWDEVQGKTGVLARLRSEGDGLFPPGRLELELRLDGGQLHGAFTFQPRPNTAGAALRSMLRPRRQRQPFRIPADQASAGELAALLQSYLSEDRQLPLPSSGAPEAPLAEQLPVPSSNQAEGQPT